MQIEAGLSVGVAEAQSRATQRIDAEAGLLRTRFLTNVPFQESTYTYKLNDCRDYLQAADPDLNQYPWVAAESRAQNMTPEQAAQNVVAIFTAWSQVGTAIEEVRLTTKRLVETQTTQAGVASALWKGRRALQGHDEGMVSAGAVTTIQSALLGQDVGVDL